MRSGEVWWARLDGRTPVVVLPDGKAVQIVEAATEEQKVGFLLLSGAEAADDDTRARLIAAAGPSVAATGAEVAVEGLGVVRVAFPRAGTIFCTWETALTDDDLIERITVLSPGKQRELEIVMRLAQSGA
jgi:mRNA interferase MazF